MVASSELAVYRSLLSAGASPLEAAGVIEDARTVEQIMIDLSSQAWKHELRGRGGQWAKSGAVAVPHVGSPTKRRAQRRAMLRAAGRLPAKPAAAPAAEPMIAPAAMEHVEQRTKTAAQRMAEPATKKMLAKAQMQTLNIAHESAQDAAKHALEQAKDIHDTYVKEHEKAESATEKKKAWKKFFAMTSSLVVGGVAGYVEAKYGVPDAAVMATSITPAIGEALFEAKNRL